MRLAKLTDELPRRNTKETCFGCWVSEPHAVCPDPSMMNVPWM